MSNYCVAGFGEIMVRFSPPEKKRFRQTLPGSLDVTFGGSEANICAGVSLLGGNSRFLTALPENAVVDSILAQLRSFGCDVSKVHFDNCGRLGLYFVEPGAMLRSSDVIYDRSYSTISMLPPEAYDFPAMLEGVTHLHLSGITAALTENAFRSTLKLAETAAAMNIKISFDPNYRKKLWRWEEGTAPEVLAGRCLSHLMPLADIIIANEEHAAELFRVSSPLSVIGKGKPNPEGCREVAEKLSERYPKAEYVVITLRESISNEHNNCGEMLLDCKRGKSYLAPVDADGNYAPYELKNIVDRVGGGDAFCAGLLYALNEPGLSDPETALRFAAAAGAFKHTIQGDFNFATRQELEKIMQGDGSGRVQR